MEKLDIEIPVLSPRVYREYKNLEELNPAAFGTRRSPIGNSAKKKNGKLSLRILRPAK